MKTLVLTGVILGAAALFAGVWLATKKKRFVLLYGALALLLVFGVLYWVLPIHTFLADTPDSEVTFVHLIPPEGEAAALEGDRAAGVLDALRETKFAHVMDGSVTLTEGETYYHLVVKAQGELLNVDVYIAPDGTARTFARTSWRYQAGDPQPLAQAIQKAAGFQEAMPSSTADPLAPYRALAEGVEFALPDGLTRGEFCPAGSPKQLDTWGSIPFLNEAGAVSGGLSLLQSDHGTYGEFDEDGRLTGIRWVFNHCSFEDFQPVDGLDHWVTARLGLDVPIKELESGGFEAVEEERWYAFRAEPDGEVIYALWLQGEAYTRDDLLKLVLSVSFPQAPEVQGEAQTTPFPSGRVWTWDENDPIPFDFSREELDAAEAVVQEALEEHAREPFVRAFSIRELKTSEHYTTQWFWPEYFSGDSALYRDWTREDTRNSMIVLAKVDVEYDGTLTPMSGGEGVVYGFTVHKNDAGEWTILEGFSTNFAWE